MDFRINEVSRLNYMFMELLNYKLLLLFICSVFIFFQGCGDRDEIIQGSFHDGNVEANIPLESINQSPQITPTPNLRYEEVITAKVVNVISGNRIEVLIDGALEKIRYHGVDIPNDDLIEGRALTFNKFLVEGRQVAIEFEKRIPMVEHIGYVYVDGVLVNAAIIEKGLGTVSILPNDISETNYLNMAQMKAQKRMVGIWSEVPSENDKLVDSSQRPIPAFEGGTLPKLGNLGSVESCDFSNSPLKVIKGKFEGGLSPGKFYTPDMDTYGRVDVVRSNGDKWFCTVEDALKEGWSSNNGE